MKNSNYLISVFLFLFALKGSAQEQDTLHICYNGGFELPLASGYQFTNDSPIVTSSFSCSYSIPAPTSYPVTSIGLDQFSDPITLVSPGYDPVLSPYSINLDRVASGNRAIKLNDITGNREATTMTKKFTISGDKIYFKFALVGGNPAADATYVPSHFRARVYNFDKSVVLAEYCIVFDDSNSEFTTGGDFNDADEDNQYYNLLYKDWECKELTILDPEMENINIGDEAYLEFWISDDGKSQFASVYIDDICDECDIDPSCEWCIDVYDDVLTSQTDEREADNCIKAYNTVNSGATAMYYAGNEVNDIIVGEVLLLPEDLESEPANLIGFECLLGSIGHFYIEDCPYPYYERHAMIQNEEQQAKPAGSLQIYPNPANSELNIVSAEASLKAIRLLSFDGKLVLERQPGADNKAMKLDVNALSSGIYILTVETSDGAVTTHKIVRE